MLDHIDFNNIMFLDIETVPVVPCYEDMDDVFKELWNKKATFLLKNDQTPKDVYQRAGIYAEFGKIVCISVGVFDSHTDNKKLHIKSYFGEDEKQILINFSEALNRFCTKGDVRYICAHNGKEFDFPYIARRMLINGLLLPKMLDVSGKKPWEVPFLDTLEFWKFGDYKHFTSLHLLATVLNIPTPKNDIDGSMVAEVYYNENNIRRIADYCEKDVIAVVQVMQRLKGVEVLTEDTVIRVS